MGRTLNIGCGLLLAFFCSGCDPTPKVSATVVKHQDTVAFHIDQKGGSGLVGLKIWDADLREMLWVLDLDYFKGDSVSYGVIPQSLRTHNGTPAKATQIFPPNGVTPKSLPKQNRLFLELICQYDSEAAASVKSFWFTFSVDEAGMVSPSVSVESPTAMDRPIVDFDR